MPASLQLTLPPASPEIPAARLVLEPLRDDADLRVWRLQGRSARLVLCFSGVGTGRDTPPEPEMVRSASANGADTVLFIADPHRCWLNRPGLIEEIVAIAKSEISSNPARQICAVGHSMGAYSAMVIPAFLPVDIVLALSPQLSVAPEFAAQDLRWMDYRNRIAAFRIKHVHDHLMPKTRYFTIFGRDPREAPQRNMAQPRRNLGLFILPSVSHNTAKRLKSAGILDQTVAAAFSGKGRPLLRVLNSAFRAQHIPHTGGSS